MADKKINTKQFRTITKSLSSIMEESSFDDLNVAKAKIIRNHFFYTNIMSLIFVGVFLYFLIWRTDEVSQFLTFMIGTIMGFYLSKTPFDIN